MHGIVQDEVSEMGNNSRVFSLIGTVLDLVALSPSKHPS